MTARPRHRFRRSGRLVAPALGAMLTLGGCAGSWGLPEPASKQGDEVTDLWRPVLVLAAVIGALVWILIGWSLIAYRRRRRDDDTLPGQRAYHVGLEVAYTLTPILIVAGLFVFSQQTESEVTDTVADPDHRVTVVGFQWQWQFRYPEEGIVVTGTPEERPTLVLPTDETTQLNLVTSDVNHAFWVPRFLSKRDLIPEVDNNIDVTPVETGRYIGHCAQYCGLDHWRMNFDVRVVSPADYDTWVADQQAAARSGTDDARDQEEGPGS